MTYDAYRCLFSPSVAETSQCRLKQTIQPQIINLGGFQMPWRGMTSHYVIEAFKVNLARANLSEEGYAMHL